VKVIRRSSKSKSEIPKDDYVVQFMPLKGPVDPTLFAYFASTQALIATTNSFSDTKEIVLRCFRLDPREWDSPKEIRT
jgi:hypothetical protein